MTYIYLALAIMAEVTATSALKASEEFTKLIPSLIIIVGYMKDAKKSLFYAV